MITRYFIILIALLESPCVAQSLETNPDAKGQVTITANEMSAQPVALNGYWAFYPNQLINPAQINSQPAPSFIQVPSWWSQDDKPNVQTATYRLKVILPNHTSTLAIGMPEVYCAYNLFVNGEKLGHNGTVGSTKENSRPQWKPETYEFASASDTIDIVLQLSNFYHHRTGIGLPILLGNAEYLVQRKNIIEISNLLLLSGLAILSVAAVIMFFIQSQNMALLFYFLLCASWMTRAAFSNHYQIVQWFPDVNWYLGVRTEYITIYLSTLFGSLLVGNLFPKDVNNAFRMFFVIASVCFTLITLVAPPILFTSFVQFYLGLSILLLVSILVIVVRAYFESRNGAGFVMFCALLSVIIFGYVILHYEDIVELNEVAYTVGFLVLFILLLIAVIQRIHNMKTTTDFQSRMTFDEVTKLK